MAHAGKQGSCSKDNSESIDRSRRAGDPVRRRIMRRGQAQAPRRHPDLPPDPGGGLLLRRQDWLRPLSRGRRRQALFPVAPAALRQEPVRGYPQGAVRGQRAAVPKPGRARRLGLVQAPSRRAPELRRRQLQAPRRAAGEYRGAVGGHRARDGRGRYRGRHRAEALRPPPGRAAPAGRAAGGRAGGRVRQTDSGRAGRAGCREGEPRRPARPVRHDQGLQRSRGAHLHHRCEQEPSAGVREGGRPLAEDSLQGQPVLRPQQSHRRHPGPRLLDDLRLHRGGPGLGLRAGTAGPGPGSDPGLVQRLQLAGNGEGLQPLRHSQVVPQPRVQGALVRNGDAAVPDRHAPSARLSPPRTSMPFTPARRCCRPSTWTASPPRRCCSRPAT